MQTLKKTKMAHFHSSSKVLLRETADILTVNQLFPGNTASWLLERRAFSFFQKHIFFLPLLHLSRQPFYYVRSPELRWPCDLDITCSPTIVNMNNMVSYLYSLLFFVGSFCASFVCGVASDNWEMCSSARLLLSCTSCYCCHEDVSQCKAWPRHMRQ